MLIKIFMKKNLERKWSFNGRSTTQCLLALLLRGDSVRGTSEHSKAIAAMAILVRPPQMGCPEGVVPPPCRHPGSGWRGSEL